MKLSGRLNGLTFGVFDEIGTADKPPGIEKGMILKWQEK
jgi:hypothetical protein